MLSPPPLAHPVQILQMDLNVDKALCFLDPEL